jgi:hypothetical protein
LFLKEREASSVIMTSSCSRRRAAFITRMALPSTVQFPLDAVVPERQRHYCPKAAWSCDCTLLCPV